MAYGYPLPPARSRHSRPQQEQRQASARPRAGQSSERKLHHDASYEIINIKDRYDCGIFNVVVNRLSIVLRGFTMKSKFPAKTDQKIMVNIK